MLGVFICLARRNSDQFESDILHYYIIIMKRMQVILAPLSPDGGMVDARALKACSR